MEFETRIHVSRRDAEINPVILLTEIFEFETEEEQRAFTEECLAWLDERPVPNGGTYARNRYKGDHRLIEMIDNLHGPDSLWESLKEIEQEIDVPSFLKVEDE